MHTLIIPVIASNVNVVSSPHAVGLPASTAISGFGHAFLRLVSQMLAISLTDKGTAMAIQSYTVLDGRSKHTVADVNSKSKASAGDMASMVDERLAYIDMHLLVRFDCSSDALIKLHDNLLQLQGEVSRLGFSGGALQSSGPICLVEHDTTGRESLGKLPFDSRVLLDRTYLISLAQALFEESALDSIIRLLKQAEEQSKDYEAFSIRRIEIDKRTEKTPEDIIDLKYLGNLCALQVGYRAIEEPKARSTRMQDRYLHVYAEPVIGLCQLQTAGSLLRMDSESLNAESVFWKYQAKHPYYVSLETLNHE